MRIESALEQLEGILDKHQPVWEQHIAALSSRPVKFHRDSMQATYQPDGAPFTVQLGQIFWGADAIRTLPRGLRFWKEKRTQPRMIQALSLTFSVRPGESGQICYIPGETGKSVDVDFMAMIDKFLDEVTHLASQVEWG
jgi:hypothetical protein